MMKYPIGITLISLIAVVLLGLPTIASAAIPQDDISAAIAQSDGTKVQIPFVEILWQGKSKRSFGIKEVDERLTSPGEPRLLVVSTRSLPISSHWACDVQGVLSTYSGISRRDGKPFTQRVLIVAPENVLVYCSAKGYPFLYPPMKSKGLEIDWPYKRTIVDLEQERLSKRRGSVLTMEEEEDPLPPMPDSPYAPDAVYCETLDDARAQYSDIARNMVELHCRPYSNVTSTQFTLGQDDPPNTQDSITVYYTNAPNLPSGGRINVIVGTIQKDVNDNYWIEIDSGPSFVGGDDIGSVYAIDDLPSIVYARTLQQGSSVELTGKVVTATQSEFPEAIYVEEPDRSAGIRVLYSGSSYQPERGDVVSVSGTIQLGDDWEREIDAGTDGVTYEEDGESIRPLGMAQRSMSGMWFNALTPSVNWPYGSDIGLHNKSLLVTIWGTVTQVDAANSCFWFSDGTGFDDGSGHIGVKVSWDWPTEGKSSILPPLEGWYVSVTGISSSEDFGSERIIRTLRPRDQNDIVIHKAGTPIVYDPVDAWQEEFTPADSSDAGGTGPSSADSVDLATGAYNNDPDPDIVAVNPLGPDAEFTRMYRSKLAESGLGSAGLSAGWTHNYDVKIVRDEAGWGDLRLVFPDGAADTLRPVIESGTPTGEFEAMGPSYLVTGDDSLTPGLWNWIQIMFPDETKLEFTSATGSPYRLRKISDIHGNSIYVNRNVDTSISSVSTDSAGQDELLGFDYNSGILTVSDVPSSRDITLSFVTEAGATVLKSVSQVNTSDLKWSYTYEEIGDNPYLTQVEVPDPTGESTYLGHPITYDGEGRVQEIKDANNNSRSYLYGENYTQVYVKNATGAVEECWTQKIGDNKEDLGLIDTNDKETSIEYDAAKRPWRFTNKNEKQSTATYDDYGNVTEVVDEAGVTTTYGYTDPDSPFRLTSVQTSGGSSTKTSTTFEYYDNGLLRYVNSPKPGTSGTGQRVTTTYTYTAMGNVETITTPAGLGTDGNPDIRDVTTTVYEYEDDTDYSYSTDEKLGQPIVISAYQGDPANGKLLTRTHLRYDSRGRLTDVIDPLIGSPGDPSDYRDRHKTTLAYNNEDRITDIRYAPTGANVNERVHRVYNYNYPSGELTSIELYSEANSLFRTIGTVPGKESELKEVLGDILGSSHAYGALYRLKEVEDINNHATSFGYDVVGNVSSMRYPGSQQYQWQYDDDHNLSKRIDGLTSPTNYGYDTTKSYLTSIDYPTGTDASLDYDDFGRLESVTDATGVVTYTYDDNDLVMTVTTDYTGDVPSKTITYAYNPDGSRRSMANPAGTFNYTYYYDATEQGLAIKTSAPWMTGATQLQCIYNRNGQIVLQKTSLVQTRYIYNSRGLRTSVQNQPVGGAGRPESYFTGMLYDAAGNLTHLSYNIPAAWTGTQLTGSIDYYYDQLDRLTREQRTCNDANYAYDVSFDHDDADNITQVRDLYLNNYNSNNQINETGYAYDANGNATDYRGYDFGYDYEDLPTTVTGGMNELTMQYRADGLRAWKQAGTTRTYFLYDGDTIICEISDSGSLSQAYLHGANGLIQRRAGTTAYTTFTYDPLGSHVQTYYYNSGTLQENLQRFTVYDAFGKRWWDKGATGINSPTTANVGYAAQWGAYTDPETRFSSMGTPLVLMGIRYYDPITARFVTRDPMLGVNDYAYCWNNPVSYVDPDGGSPIVMALQRLAPYASRAAQAGSRYAGIAWNWTSRQASAAGSWVSRQAIKTAGNPNVAKAATKGVKVTKRAGRVSNVKKGETIHTIRGRGMHKAIQAKAKAKGWGTEVTRVNPTTGKKVRVDILTPSGNPVSIKPNTLKWQKYGMKDLEKYEDVFGKKGRVIYYEP